MEVKKMAETTIKRGRGRPKKEKLLRNITVGVFYQSPNYYKPVQVAEFKVSEKTGDFEYTIMNNDTGVSRPSIQSLKATLSSGFPRYYFIDKETGGQRDVYRDNSFDDWANNLEYGQITLSGVGYTLNTPTVEYETE